MPAFSPYTIKHLQVELVKEILLPKGNYYLVFWFRQIPIGHLWIEASDSPVSFLSLKQKITDALSPALNYYLEKYDHEMNWKRYLEESDFAGIYNLLTHSFEQLQNDLLTEINDITVVICTRNRPEAIKQCLQTLMGSSDKNFEIIVVDNAPDDKSTESIVLGFPGVKYILEKRKGLDIARNTGARYATHNIIAYTDDDVVLPLNWVKTMKQCFNDPLTMAVTGMVLPLEIETNAQFIFEKEWSFNKGYLPMLFDHSYFLDHVSSGVPAWDIGAGANMAFRKEAFMIAGFFDERLDVGASGCSGDSEMWYRIMAEGWNCCYNPQLYVFHRHRRSIKDLQQQLYYYMRGHVSALLVQYENYHHKGNLDRVYKGFPKYFYYRLKNYFKTKENRNNSFIIPQIKGCISGWKYYQENKKRQRQDIFTFPENLRLHVSVSNLTVISVIIPCYNQGHYLKHAIESVLQQTHKKLEVIVVDDGSNDITGSVCSIYGEQVKYVRVERVGISAARNIGVKFSQGDFVVFLDADDFLYPGALELNLYYFGYYPGIVFVSGGHVRIDEKGNQLPLTAGKNTLGNNYLSLLQGNYIAMQATVMYRRDLFYHFHFDPSLRYCEDYEFNLSIARNFPVFGHSGIVAAYRIHSMNTSANKNLMLAAAIRVLRKQERLLINDEERKALQSGLKNWHDLYLHS